jgi:integrase
VSEQLVIPGAELVLARDDGPALTAVRAAAELAAQRVNRPHAKNTQEAYDRHWERWGKWCDAVGRAPFPVDPPILCVHLEWLSLELKLAPNTVRQALAAIADLDKWKRYTAGDANPASVATSPIVERWLESWGRDNPRAPRKKAAPIEVQAIWALLEAVNTPSERAAKAMHLMRATRDRAMILIGIYGGLRGAELAGLTVTDLRFADRGLELRLQRSKTDQQGEGQWKGLLPASARELCPVDAWRTWITVRGPNTGPAFMAIHRNGDIGTTHLTTRTVQSLIKGYAKRAGLEHVSSHSLRATLATLAGKRGHRIEHVAEHLGHSSLETTAGYMRRGQLFDERNPTAGLFDGD